MRDILIHEYFSIDLELTQKVIKEEIAELKKGNVQNKGRVREKVD